MYLKADIWAHVIFYKLAENWLRHAVCEIGLMTIT